MEMSKYSRGRTMSRPCTYAIGNTAKDEHIKFYGISGKEKVSW